MNRLLVVPLLGAVALVVVLLLARGSSLVWERRYGGSRYDCGRCIVGTDDGGFMIAGYTRSFGAGGFDVYLLRIDSAGNKLWEKTYGDGDNQEASGIVPSGDGGFVVAGWTQPADGAEMALYLIRVDEDGDALWERRYEGNTSYWAGCIVESGDGGFMVGGYTGPPGGSDVYLLKIDGNGNKVWEKTYGGAGDDTAHCIIQSGDGGFVVGGISTSFGRDGSKDAYLLRIDSEGNKLWEKAYGGGGWDEALGVAVAEEGEFVVAGMTKSFGNESSHVYIFRVNDAGEKIWERVYGSSGPKETTCIVKSDGGFVLAGVGGRITRGGDAYILGIDGAGKKLWQRTRGGPSFDWIYSIVRCDDGGFAIVGRMDNDPRIGPGAPNNTSERDMDVYVLKYRAP